MENKLNDLEQRILAIESVLSPSMIGELKAILLYIGHIEQVQLYANSLQETLDKYVSPLYIENTDNTGTSLFIDSYLGDPENVPAYSLIKVRASHNFVADPNVESTIVFKKGEVTKAYALRKMVVDSEGKKAFVTLEDNDFIAGNIYEIYFDSQNVAVISSSNAGVTALTLAQTLSKQLEDLKAVINKLGITDNGMTITGKITATDIETNSAKINNTMNISNVTGLVLPAGTTIQSPTSQTGVANKDFVEKTIENYTLDFFAKKHKVGTVDAAQASNSMENESFYFKIGD